VLILLEKWLHYINHDVDTALLQKVEDFVAKIDKSSHEILFSKIQRCIRQLRSFLKISYTIPNLSLSAPSLSPCELILNTNAVTIAEQLTLADHEFLRLIKKSELVQDGISNNDQIYLAPYVNAMSKRTDVICRWWFNLVLWIQPTKRIALVEKMFNIALLLHKLNNWFGVFMLVMALYTPTLTRLKSFWENFKLQHADLYTSVSELRVYTDRGPNNYKDYRDLVTSCPVPAVPFIGLYFSDLYFIGEGNKTKVDGKINFSKAKQITTILNLFERFQQYNYSFTPLEPLATLFRYFPTASEKHAHKLSKYSAVV